MSASAHSCGMRCTPFFFFLPEFHSIPGVLWASESCSYGIPAARSLACTRKEHGPGRPGSVFEWCMLLPHAPPYFFKAWIFFTLRSPWDTIMCKKDGFRMYSKITFKFTGLLPTYFSKYNNALK